MNIEEAYKSDLESANEIIVEQQEEIERLTELCNKYEEEHKTTFETWQKDIKENELLHSIIKEVREKINATLTINSDYVDYDFGTELLRQELLDILKGSDKE